MPQTAHPFPAPGEGFAWKLKSGAIGRTEGGADARGASGARSAGLGTYPVDAWGDTLGAAPNDPKGTPPGPSPMGGVGWATRGFSRCPHSWQKTSSSGLF